MKTATIKNPTLRTFHLPRLWKGGKPSTPAEKRGESHRPKMLKAMKSVDVPEWYLTELRKLKAWGPKRLSGENEIQPPPGAAGRFHSLVMGRRRRAAKGVTLADLKAQIAELQEKVEHREKASKDEAKAERGAGSKK